MEREKKTFVKSLNKIIFCIIVTLLFGRSIAFCQDIDEFGLLDHEDRRNLAMADPGGGFSIEILSNQNQPFTSPLADASRDLPRSVPVPPAGVTVLVFIAAMVVGWLRRRTPSELPH